MRLLMAMLLGMVAANQTGAPSATDQVDRSALGITYHGGDFDGLVTAEQVTSQGRHYVGLHASPPNASPVPRTLAPIVDGVVGAFLNHRPELYAKFVQPDAESYVGCSYLCNVHRPFIGNGFPFVEKLTANTPYYMGEGQLGPLVRIEWLHDGQLWYLSFLHFRDGKISKVNTIKATPPPITRVAPPPLPSRGAN